MIFFFFKERLTLANMFRFGGLNTNDLSQLEQSWDGPSITRVHDAVCGGPAAGRRGGYDGMRHDDAAKRFKELRVGSKNKQKPSLAAADQKRLHTTPMSIYRQEKNFSGDSFHSKMQKKKNQQ